MDAGMPDEETLDVRGQLLLNITDYVKELRGINGVLKLHMNVSERYGTSIGLDSVLPKEWYPHRLFRIFVEEAAAVVEKDVGRFAEEAGRYAAEHRGVLRAFIKISGPQNLAKRLQYAWEKYHRVGRVEVVEIGENHGTVRLHDYFYGPYVCRGFESNIRRYLEYTAENVSVEETRCRSRGDPFCEFRATWE